MLLVAFCCWLLVVPGAVVLAQEVAGRAREGGLWDNFKEKVLHPGKGDDFLLDRATSKEVLGVSADIDLSRESVHDGTLWLPLELLDISEPNTLVKMCLMDYGMYQAAPWSYPMYESLRRKSCTKDRVVILPLAKLMSKLERDSSSMHPTGFVFHETRCGSTLVANLLASVGINRVFSEARPMTQPFRAFMKGGEIPSEHREKFEFVMKSMFQLMGRQRPGEVHQNLFFKFQNSKFAPQITNMYSAVPWVYIFRDPVEVMMSLIGKGEMMSPCTRGHFAPRRKSINLPVSLKDPLYKDMTVTCAKWLLDLNLSALTAYNAHPEKGLMVSYPALPDAVIQYIYQHHFQASGPEDWQPAMLEATIHYSKSRPGKEKSVQDDTQRKHDAANEQILQACDEFLYPTFHELMGMQSWNQGL